MTILKLLRLADAFTIVNAALGFLAITYISDAKYLNAEILLLLAVVADGLDGIVARRFGGGKESMGDYLDIMADYLSFCVAPAILFYQLYFDVAASPVATMPQDILVGVAAALLVIFGLLRLARHVAKGGPEAGRFTGLPTTGAGLFAVLLIAEGGLGDVVTALLIAAVACLMVTEIPFPKVRGPTAVASGGAVVAAAVVLALIPAGAPLREIVLLVALAGAAAYATSGVAFGLLRIPVGHEEAAQVKAARNVKGKRDALLGSPADRDLSTMDLSKLDDREMEELYERMVVSNTDSLHTKLEQQAALRREVENTATQKEQELSQVTSEHQRRRIDMDATMRRLQEREERLLKLKERIRTPAVERAQAEAHETAERLREVERREKELDRREATLAKKDPPRQPKDVAKGKRRREGESQEVDPDA